ncbi:MAG TPA: type II toxin-antitoxin system VapB family antitoxin [Bryobacteraceae bacterium]|nr:PSK operon transcription factor [Bryobacterales bacterium]HRJ22062.1 type II toxin-antitoxin system VapB family antitoxin [Bryobacteraceae bacterium]
MSVLNIKDPEAHAMAKELARRTGKSLTAVVKEALQERLRREPPAQQEQERLQAYLMRISAKIRALPVLDDRTADEIIGYDEHGVPR